MLNGELRKGQEAERGEVRERLVEEPDQVVQSHACVRERQLQFVVVGREMATDDSRVVELVIVSGLGESDGEGLDRLAGRARHQRRDQA